MKMMLKKMFFILNLLVFKKNIIPLHKEVIYINKYIVYMSKLLDNFLSFLSSATHEQLEANWKYLELYENIGPNAREFVEYCMGYFLYSLCNDVSNSIIVNNKKNPEYSFGFFHL